MDKITIGCMSGCISFQKGFAKEDLYHYLLHEKLKTDNADKGYTFCLGMYDDYSEFVEKTLAFIEKKKPEILLLFIRPFPLMILLKLLIKYESANHEIKRKLNPRLFFRDLNWPAAKAGPSVGNEYHFVPRKYIELRDINLMMGYSLGLHDWAMKFISHEMKKINEHCLQRGIKLFIVSPPSSPGSMMGEYLCKKTAVCIERICKEEKIAFININELSLQYFEEDKIHFNAEGHKMVAKLLYEGIKDLNGILAESCQMETILQQVNVTL